MTVAQQFVLNATELSILKNGFHGKFCIYFTMIKKIIVSIKGFLFARCYVKYFKGITLFNLYNNIMR